MERGGQRYFYHVDHLGSIRTITDAAGTEVNAYDYDGFGQLKDTVEGVPNPYTFTGREQDPESGLNYNRARYYCPRVGRFISADPLGFDADDQNLYRYVFNNPVNFTDNSGQICIPCIFAFFGASLLLTQDTPIPPAEQNPQADIQGFIGLTLLTSAFCPQVTTFFISKPNVIRSVLPSLRREADRLAFRGPPNSLLRGGDVARGVNAGGKRALRRPNRPFASDQLLGKSQVTVAQMEKRTDVMLSTLRSYIEAMGGTLDLVVRFPDREPVILKGLSDDDLVPSPPEAHGNDADANRCEPA